jgi:hypothetical protein
MPFTRSKIYTTTYIVEAVHRVLRMLHSNKNNDMKYIKVDLYVPFKEKTSFGTITTNQLTFTNNLLTAIEKCISKFNDANTTKYLLDNFLYGHTVISQGITYYNPCFTIKKCSFPAVYSPRTPDNTYFERTYINHMSSCFTGLNSFYIDYNNVYGLSEFYDEYCL